MLMKTLKVSRTATVTMTTRPTLRSSWEIVRPRFSRMVVTESSPSSTDFSIRSSGELDRAKRQPGEQPDAEYPAASPNDELAVDLRSGGDAVDDVVERGQQIHLNSRRQRRLTRCGMQRLAST